MRRQLRFVLSSHLQSAQVQIDPISTEGIAQRCLDRRLGAAAVFETAQKLQSCRHFSSYSTVNSPARRHCLSTVAAAPIAYESPDLRRPSAAGCLPGEDRERIAPGSASSRSRRGRALLSVILINPFEVPEGTDDEEFLRGWERAADYMRQQPGFLSSRLHRALRPDARFRFINVAEWSSPQEFQAAVSSEQFREIAKDAGPGAPALYEVVRSM